MYKGPTSYIPPHCDDERSIHPESSIFTISMGKEVKIKFSDLHGQADHEHLAKDGSLYSMTRQSQGFYKHSIDKNPSWAANDLRFSITFRSVHWRNNNSTLLVGDSNTGGLKFAKFGGDSSSELKGTFGNAMPGKRVEAFTINDLDPVKCVGYNNIVIHCGVNSIRDPSIVSNDEVRNTYVDFKSKINQFTAMNKRSRIYVNTLLPTKTVECNKKIEYFNKLLVTDLIKTFKNIRINNFYTKFTDVRGQLSRPLSRDTNASGQPDNLHLNDDGLRLLSVNIKRAIFESKNQKESTGDGATAAVASSTSWK